jgi:tetratricopeptide (TPR) repeat protein
MGNYQQAMEHYEQALTIIREMGDRQSEANVLSKMGEIHAQQGENQQAIELFEQVLEISDDPDLRAIAEEQLESLHQEQE